MFTFMPMLWLAGLGSWLAYFGHGRTSLGVALGLVLLLGVDRTAFLAHGSNPRGGWVARFWVFTVLTMVVQVLMVASASSHSWLVLGMTGACLLLVGGGGTRIRRATEIVSLITVLVFAAWFVFRESLHLGTTHLLASWSVTHLATSSLVHTVGWTAMTGIGVGLVAFHGGVARARRQVGMSLLVLAVVTVWQAIASVQGWPLLPLGDAVNAAFGHPYVFAVLVTAATGIALPTLVHSAELAWGSDERPRRVVIAAAMVCGVALAAPQITEFVTSHQTSFGAKTLSSIEMAQAGFVVLLLWWPARAMVALIAQRQRFVEFVPPLCTFVAGGLGAFVIGDAWSTDTTLGHVLTLAGVVVVLLAVVCDVAAQSRGKESSS